VAECWIDLLESPLQAGDPLLLSCSVRLPSDCSLESLTATLCSLIHQSFRNVEVILPPEPWPLGFDLELWRERCRSLRGLHINGLSRMPSHYQFVITAGIVLEPDELLALEWRLRRQLEQRHQ